MSRRPEGAARGFGVLIALVQASSFKYSQTKRLFLPNIT